MNDSPSVRPNIGNWYQRLDTGEQFEVVAIDSDDGSIETQDRDGELDVIEWTQWQELELAALGPSALRNERSSHFKPGTHGSRRSE